MMRLLVMIALAFVSFGAIAPAQTPTQPEPKEAEATASPGAAEAEAKDPFDDLSPALKIVLILTALTVLPAVLMTMTSFTRIIIVLGFVRRALSVQETPPNQVLIGLSLFLTILIMSPVLKEIHEKALEPYLSDDPAVQVGLSTAASTAAGSLSRFLLDQTQENDILLMLEVTASEKPNTPAEVPLHVLIPAFALSELRTAFQMGFLIYLPFLIVDLVVASILLSMGMFMLPPVIISTPFKVLLFVLVDGWDLVVQSLVKSFLS